MSERDPFSPPAAAVTEAVARALAEDLGPLGDITAALLPDTATGSATVVAREAGVLAGTACATEVFYRLDPDLDIQWNLSDGERLSASVEVRPYQATKEISSWPALVKTVRINSEARLV